MRCDEAANLVSRRLDGELPADEPAAPALDAHLAGCAECRAAAEAMPLQDAALVRAFAGRRSAAESIADRVAASISPLAPPAPGRSRSPLLLVAVAASLALAAGSLIWPLFRQRPKFDAITKNTRPVAQVTLTRGNAFTCPSHAPDDWRPLAAGASVAEGSRVRTAPSARLELRLPGGSLIRLNESTDARLLSPASLELGSGQIWSSVPPQAPPLRVTAPAAPPGPLTAVTSAGGRAHFACTSGAAVLTALDRPATVIDPRGTETPVAPGEAATLGDPAALVRCSTTDVLLSTRWMDDLLVLKGRDDPERIGRVKELLARINSEQSATRPATGPSTGPATEPATSRAVSPSPFEQLLRGEGDRWSEPMACYVCSPASRGDREQRLTAARLLADLAPPSVIPELIALLADPEPDIRLHASRALHRLTGQTLGRSPELCAAEKGRSLGDTQRKWQAWWGENRARYGRSGS